LYPKTGNLLVDIIFKNYINNIFYNLFTLKNQIYLYYTFFNLIFNFYLLFVCDLLFDFINRDPYKSAN
jgi:hypothetical protein